MSTKFPIEIKRGSVTVRIRCQHPSKQYPDYEVFTLDYHEGGRRERPSFATLKEARKEAETAAERLARTRHRFPSTASAIPSVGQRRRRPHGGRRVKDILFLQVVGILGQGGGRSAVLAFVDAVHLVKAGLNPVQSALRRCSKRCCWPGKSG